MFAAHLVEKKYYEEAGLILVRANLLEDALDLFLKSSNWQMYINVCLKLNIASIKLVEKLNVMIGIFINVHSLYQLNNIYLLFIILDKLKSENKFLECAKIYEIYLKDPENSIICLIDGHHWCEAITAVFKRITFHYI